MRKAYIFLFALILWGFLFWYHYVFHLKSLGKSTTEPIAITVPKPTLALSEERQLLFKPNTYGLILNDSKTAVIDSIISMGKENQLLQITGLYSSSEQDGLDFDLGLARASELKQLLLDSLAEQRIEIYSDTVSNFTYYKDSLIEAIFYEWVDNYVEDTPSNYYLINHPNKRIKTESYEALLDKIAKRLIETGERVIIRGHTDSKGDSELNFTIALRNAKDIRDIFKEKGVKIAQITTTTRGEEEPITNNDTEIGRKENRRIEIEISL